MEEQAANAKAEDLAAENETLADMKQVKEVAKALREKDTLKALRHDHVVSFFSHAVSNDFIYVALEPFVALPLVEATSLTLKHIVKEKKEARWAVGWGVEAVDAGDIVTSSADSLSII